MKRLENKKAVVTGGAQGLGYAIVEHLAGEGCDVVAWDVNAEKVQETAAELARATGRRITGAAVDVTLGELRAAALALRQDSGLNLLPTVTKLATSKSCPRGRLTL